MIAKNMSGTDRVFRLLLAFFLITFWISGQIGAWGGIAGLVLLLTATLARCPMYAVLGFKVNKSS